MDTYGRLTEAHEGFMEANGRFTEAYGRVTEAFMEGKFTQGLRKLWRVYGGLRKVNGCLWRGYGSLRKVYRGELSGPQSYQVFLWLPRFSYSWPGIPMVAHVSFPALKVTKCSYGCQVFP